MENNNSGQPRRRSILSVDPEAPRRKITGKRMPGINIERKSVEPSLAKAEDLAEKAVSTPTPIPLSGGRSMYFGMTPSEISKMCVPKSREEQFASLVKMNSLDKSSKEIIEPFRKRFEKWAEDKSNDADFSTGRLSQLSTAVEKALLESSEFLNAVHKYGMPSIVVRSEAAEKALMERGFIKEHLDSTEKSDQTIDFVHSVFDPFGNEISFSPKSS